MGTFSRVTTINWKWVINTLLRRRRQFAGVIITASIAYAAGLIFPITVQKIVDKIIGGRADTAAIPLILLGLAAVGVESFMFSLRQAFIIELAVFLDRQISRKTFVHLLRVRFDVAQLTSGEVVNHFQQILKVRDFILYQIPFVFLDVGGAIISLVLVFYYDVVVGMALLVALPALALLAGNQIAQARQSSEAFYKSFGARQAVLTETVTGLETIKSLAIESSRLQRWEFVSNIMLINLRKIMNINRNYMLRAQIASRLITILVIALGCWRMFAGQLSVGELLALQLLAGRIAAPVLASGDFYRNWQDVDSAMRQAGKFLTLPHERPTISSPVRFLRTNRIVISDLSLAYPNSDRYALLNISLNLPEKGFVAVVGRNGSGKTSLMRILLGLQKEYNGSVEIGGHDLRSINIRWLRGHMSSVSQETVLFAGTIRENLQGTSPVTDAQLWHALKFAGAADFVESLPQKLDCELTENGQNLSGGQRQRLSIARAIVRDPVIAFFDEPTAFLDPEAALALETKLAYWGRERLLILVTHHLAAIQSADLIVVLDEGQLVSWGSHSALLDSSPVYLSLWNDYMRIERS